MNSFHKLEISIAEAEIIALDFFGIVSKAQVLPGEVDFNFLLRDEKGQGFTLKISRPETDVKELDFQADIIQHLANGKLLFQIPKIIPSKNNNLREAYIDRFDQLRWVRLQSWLEGRMLGDVNPRTPELLESWGNTCGHLSKALEHFDHPAAHRFYKWNPSETLFSRKYLKFIQGKHEQEIASYFWDLFEEKTLKILPQLRQSVNYNDAHEQNLLVNNNLEHPEISGIIDFGDVLFTQTVNELAIACAYACMYKTDPLEAACLVIHGYHQIFPLEERELEVLYYLIAARLLITVANSAWNKTNEPDNEYLVVSEKPAWDLLKKWHSIYPQFAYYSFREAVGWEPHPKAKAFKKWCLDSNRSFDPVIKFENRSIQELDLSIGSLELGNNANFDNEKIFNRTLQRMLEDKSADIGVGGYGEIRPFYTTDAYETEGNSGVQWRTAHLGIDIWTSAGTPVFAPLSGVVHSFCDNYAYRDYGPTIILEHKISEQEIFYTLYGHLARTSFDALNIGMFIAKGQQIATIGETEENGKWPPHLHFQVVLDMMDRTGDFPGVAYPSKLKVWKSICPNPQLLNPQLLIRESKPETSTDKILGSRREHLGKSLSISYKKPLHIVRGFKQYLYDNTARRYLDTVNNVAHVGHEHPTVLKAATQQMALLNTNTRYLHRNIVNFAEELLQTFPPELSVVFFVNSGSEANELALRMAKTVTQQKDTIAIEVGYHGNTGACVDVSSYKFDGKGGKGAPEHTHILPIPDVYRGIYRNSKTPGTDYANHVNEVIANVKAKGRGIAAFIGESIISCGGQIMLPEDYLKNIYSAIRNAGGLCIADEVQVGFGRVGEKFWGYELHNVVPDIVTMGKPIGNGHPLAAVVTTQKIANAFANGMEYFNTFGGNPVSCAVGSAVLQVIKEEQMQKNALETGRYLKQKLMVLKSIYPVIGDVRGSGLFLGFELINDPHTLEPATKKAIYLADRMRDRGVLMSVDGPHNNVMKIKPPLCFSMQNADFLCLNLDIILKEDFMQV